MSLSKEYIKSGNFFFKYRSYIPFIILIPLMVYIYIFPKLFFTSNENWLYICLLISFSGQMIRIITVGFTPLGTSGRNTKKQVARVLNTTGIYSLVRHPLYLGNYLIWFGLILYCYNIFSLVIVSIYYYYYYQKIMYAEEDFLITKFNSNYYQWSKNVPSFIPKIHGYVKSTYIFNIKNIIIREYANISAIILSYLLISYYSFLMTSNQEPLLNQWKLIIFSVLIFFFICRYIKKTNKV